MARPRIQLTKEQLHQLECLSAMGASQEEIANFFGMSSDTLMRRFAGPLQTGRMRMKSNLRIMQMKVAMKGNVSMLIWLGKQILGQADKFNVDNSQNTGFEFVAPEKSEK